VKFVEGFKPKDIDGSETRDITLTIGGQEMRFKGEPYLVHFAAAELLFPRDPCGAVGSTLASAISSA